MKLGNRCDTPFHFESLITFIISNDYFIGIPPAVIAAIASRESRGGKLLNKTNGWGDDHNAYGIMQVKTICNEKLCSLPLCLSSFSEI